MSTPLISRIPVRVRYSETDRMGVVHHAQYLDYLEMGRVHLMELSGYPYRKTEESGAFSPVTELWARYWKSVTFDDQLVVQTWYRDITRVRMTFAYRLTLAVEGEKLDAEPSGDLIAEALTMHARIDRSGRPSPYPDDFAQAVVALLLERDPSPGRLRRR